MSNAQVNAKKQIEKKIENKGYVFCNLSCSVCENNNFEIIAEKDGYGIYCPVVICKNCGLVQQNPKMSQESYNELYEKEYRDLYDGESDDGAAENYFFYQHMRGKDIFDYIVNNEGKSFCGKRVLEIGCGAGGILKYFQEQGNEVFGIDPAPDYVKCGSEHGLSLEVATLQTAKIPWKPDLVIYNNVMEHLINPVTELKQLSTLINKDTLLYIGVPNLKSINKNYGSDLLKFIEIAHTFYFTLVTLQNVLSVAGYSFLRGIEGMGIRAIFMPTVQSNNKEVIKNDYEQTVLFLKNAEKYRFFPTPTKIIFWAKRLFVVFLKKTGLFHWFFQKIYRKTTN